MVTAGATDPSCWWEDERVAWADLDERRRTLDRWRNGSTSGAGADDAPWFAADGPEVGGLQRVVLRGEPRAADDPVPALLEDTWYPGAVVPPCLPAVLAVATTRVLAWEPGDPRVLGEARSIVSGLVPAPQQRATYLAAASWLERVAERIGQAEPPELDTAPAAPPELPDPEPFAYAAHRRDLTGHCERVAPDAGVTPDEARQRIVARLVHATNVLGRLAPDALRTEARLLADLAR